MRVVSYIQILHLNAALKRHVFSKVPTKMIMQRALINTLMMITLANIVKHTLHQQPHQVHNHQKPHKEPSHHDSGENPIVLPTVHHNHAENTGDNPAGDQIGGDEDSGEPEPALEEVVGLLHGGEAVEGLEDRDDRGEVPEGGDGEDDGGGGEEGEGEEEEEVEELD